MSADAARGGPGTGPRGGQRPGSGPSPPGSGRAPAGPGAPCGGSAALPRHRYPVSRAAHPAARPVSATVTVALAGLAALITLWLGFLAHFSGDQPAPAALPDQLAVVQVQAGETLQQLAGRVARTRPPRRSCSASAN